MGVQSRYAPIVYEITVVMRALLGSDSGIDSVVVAVIHDSIRDYVITVGISPMSGQSDRVVTMGKGGFCMRAG